MNSLDNTLLPPQNPSQDKEWAAKRIQRFWRSHRIAAMIITSAQMETILKETYDDIAYQELKLLSTVISKLSVLMVIKPSLFKGEGKRISILKVIGNDGKSGIIPSPATFWIHLSPEGRKVRIQFYGSFIAEGVYKRVMESVTLVIGLDNPDSKSIEIIDTVLYRSKDSLDEKTRRKSSKEEIAKLHEENLREIKKSLEVMRDLFPESERLLDPQIKIAGIPEVFRTYQGTSRIRAEWDGLFFPTTARNIAKTKKIPLNRDSTKTIIATVGHCLTILQEILYTCQKMHEKGKVHRDVKSANILVKFNLEAESPEGYLTDFDLISPFGNGELTDDYPYWDRASSEGIVLPTCDIFGAGITLGDMLLDPDFYRISSIRFSEADSISGEIQSKMTQQMKKLILYSVQSLQLIPNTSSEFQKCVDSLADLYYWKSPMQIIAEIEILTQKIMPESKEAEDICKQLFAEIHLCVEMGKVKRINNRIKDALKKKEGLHLDLFLDELKSDVGENEEIAAALEQITIMAESPQSHEIICELIKTKIDWLAENFLETTQSCKWFIADIIAFRAIASLLCDLFEQDTLMYNYLIYHPYGSEFCFQLCDKSTPLEEKLALMEELYQKFPIFKTFRSRLQSIHQNWASE